jgi:hypothetical protein
VSDPNATSVEEVAAWLDLEHAHHMIMADSLDGSDDESAALLRACRGLECRRLARALRSGAWRRVPG